MKYIAYYRVSTKQQGDSGLGLESQKSYIYHFLDASDIVKEFTEVASAKDLNRPKLQQAIELCRKNGYILAVAKIDRLSRKTEDALSVYSQLDRRLYSCDIPGLNGENGKFTLTLFMAIADRERELISIRTKDALSRLKEKGKKLGNKKNLTKSGRKKGVQTVIENSLNHKANKQAMPIILRMRKTGKTYQSIADYLNDKEYKTRNGNDFFANTIRQLYKQAKRHSLIE